MMQTIDYEALDLKAKLGQFSTFDSMVVMPEVQKLKPGQIYLEIGVDRGKSLSIACMVADPGVEVYGIDISAPDPKVEGAHYIKEDANVVAKTWDKKIAVLFIDGDHTYEGCKADIDSWYPHMEEHGVILFHDADSNGPGILRAIEEFCKENGKEVYYDPNQRCSMARIRL